MILRLMLVFAVFANLVVFGGGIGLTHTAANYYPNDFPNPPVGWKFAPSFPTNQKRDRVKDAAQHWNAVTGVSFSFSFQGEANELYNPFQDCGVSYNGVFERDFVDFGETEWCYKQNGNLDSIAIVMESGSDAMWDLGPGDTGNHVYESVTTHEFGHATGFGAGSDFPGGSDLLHFLPASAPSGICWNDSTVHTMCSGDAGGLPVDGRFITLEEHDIETFQNGY
jgi:hypothetical protein